MLFGSDGEIIILKLNRVILLAMGPDSACNERVYDCWDFFGFLAEGFEGEFAIACLRELRSLGPACLHDFHQWATVI